MAAKEEIETVITWTSADEMATVYTMHDRVRKKCVRVGKEINLEQGIRNGKKVAWTFLVPIDCVGVRPARKGVTPSQGQLEGLKRARLLRAGREMEQE